MFKRVALFLATNLAVLALVTLALSGMAYHYVEKPGIALGKRLGKRST